MYERLIVRINGFMRKIHLIVIHCSATRADKELTAFDLDTMHRRRGFNGTGYHYYIRKDGTTHLTRPVERIGAHAKGFNAESIGICYEGGLDCRGRPADTRTTFIADTYRMSVETFGVCSDAFDGAGEVHCSILADVVVITCSVKSTPTVLHLQVIRGERTVGTGGGTVDHDQINLSHHSATIFLISCKHYLHSTN